jgi:hypothetical protein
MELQLIQYSHGVKATDKERRDFLQVHRLQKKEGVFAHDTGVYQLLLTHNP